MIATPPQLSDDAVDRVVEAYRQCAAELGLTDAEA